MFKIEKNDDDERYFVKHETEGWFFVANSKREADFMLEQLEKLVAPSEPNSLEDYFNEWERCIEEMGEKERELINLKESYAQMEQEIIDNTDFKEIYGYNNQNVSDNHVKNELKDIVDTKHDLELRINYLKRRIDFIKSLMSMQRTLIYAGVIE